MNKSYSHLSLDERRKIYLEVSGSKCNTFLFIVKTERNARWKQGTTDTYVRANGI